MRITPEGMLAGAPSRDPQARPTCRGIAAAAKATSYRGGWLAVLEAMLGFLREPASPGRLTGRELEVAGLVAEELTNQAIASRLSVAPR